MIKALELPSEIDLAAFCQFLSQQGVRFRVTEEGLNQVLWVETEETAALVRTAYERSLVAELPQSEEVNETRSPLSTLVSVFIRFPLTLGLIVVNVIALPVGLWGGEDVTSGIFSQMILFQVCEIGGELYVVPLGETLASGQVWRLITPMFLHFSMLHIVFNLLWVWEIGRRIEMRNGALLFLVVVLVSAVVSHLLQYLVGGPGIVGGMSGVVFGLLGHSLVWSRLVPNRSTELSNGVYVFMLVYLVAAFTGVFDFLTTGSVANWAHLGGLLAGLATGGLTGLVVRMQQKNPR